MLDVALSPDTAAPRILDSFRACLSSVLEIPLDEVPQHEDDLRGAVGQWRTWLAGRGVGLVPIAHASRFQWPGVLDSRPRRNARVHGTDGSADVRLAVRRRSQSTEFDAAGASGRRSPGGGGVRHRPLRPCVERRFGRSQRSAPSSRLRASRPSRSPTTPRRPCSKSTTARAIPGRGLDGDRYANRAGTFTPRSGRVNGYDLTLIEAEVLDELTLADGQRLGYAEARRNIVTRGIELNTLVGQRFKIGDVECVGRRLCEPCAHLERLTHKGVLRKLIHRGGLRADILTTGSITLGATIERLEPDQPNPPK